ncbi:MAG: nusB [Glaciihabitans sp.]|nr:nusB [Glaciihabitans sp.]
MGARSKARKRALDVLYGADVREESINVSLLAEETREIADGKRASSWPYAKEIIEGIVAHGDEIDELIETYAQGWTLDRMPAVDRAIIRIGIWELLFNPAVPDTVAISEAVESATVLSTEDSAGFVNGLLARIAQIHA